MSITQHNKTNTNAGSALVYILIAIALLAALTASFMRPSSQQTTAQSGFNTVTDLKSQISYVRSAIQECVLTYPAGEGRCCWWNKFSVSDKPIKYLPNIACSE